MFNLNLIIIFNYFTLKTNLKFIFQNYNLKFDKKLCICTSKGNNLINIY